MTVAAINAFDIGTGNGAAKTFPFSFRCQDPQNISVYVDGLKQTIGYTTTIDADGEGGSITFDTAPANASVVLIASIPSFTMTTQFGDSGPFLGSSMDGALDAGAVRDIFLKAETSRSIKAPRGEQFTADLPAKTLRVGKFLTFDADGNPIVVDSATGADTTLRSNLAASTGSSLIGWIMSGLGAVARSILDKLRDTPSIKDWGAVGDGAADDYAAIQAAVNAIIAAGGGDLLVPKGDFKITQGILINGDGVRLRGANKKKSRLIQATVGQPVLNVTNNYCSVEHLSVDYSGIATSASTAAIIAAGQYCNYRSIVINNPYNGLKFCISPFQTANDIQVFNYINSGIYLTAVNDVFVSQFVLDAGNAVNGANGGIRLVDRVEAFSFTDGEVLNGVYPLFAAASLFTSGNRPAYGQFTNVFFDSAVQAAQVNKLVETNFTRCWFSNGRAGTGSPGCLVDQVDTVSFTSCQFFNCGSHGCNVTANAKRTSWVNCSFESNSYTTGVGVAHGITFAAGATDFTIIGGKAHNGLFTGQQGYGIAISAGASDNYAILGVNVNGNVTAGILDGGTGTNKHVANNLGYRTRNRGSALIAIGSSSVVIPHGLNATPAQADVMISPNVNLGAAGITSMWVSAVDATNITVSTNVNATSTVSLTWDARVKGS